MSRTTATLIGLIVLGGAMHAHAQEQTQAQTHEQKQEQKQKQKQKKDTGPVTLKEVVVTAQRSKQNLQAVPVSVSAFSAEQLEERQINSAIDLIRNVPNMTGSHNTGVSTANVYYLRGLGNNESIPTFDPAVGTYVDDVFMARQNANNVALLDVERVEVLRGPQGILFGRNTTAGAINIITRKPEDTYFSEFDTSVGNFSTWSAKGVLNVPVSKNVDAKLIVYKNGSDGYMRNSTTGQKHIGASRSQGGRLDVLIKPNEAINWLLSADYTDSHSQLPGSRVSNNNLYGAKTAFIYTDGGDIFAKTAKGIGTPGWVIDRGVSSHLTISLGEQSLEAITALRKFNQSYALDFADWPLFPGDATFVGNDLLSPYVIANDGHYEQFTQEIKMNGPILDGRVRYVAGAFFMTEHNWTDLADNFTVGGDHDAIPNNGFFLSPFFRRILKNDLKTGALYSQFDWDVTDRLTLTAGARYTDERKHLSVQPIGGLVSFDTAAIRAAGIPTSLSTSKLTPKAAAEYKFAPDIRGFISYTQGFKSGGWNGRSLSASAFNSFGPERAKSWEAGLKSEWLDRHLRVNLTAFDAKNLGLQLTTLNRVNAFVTDNAGDAHTRGLELEWQAAVTKGLALYGSLSTLSSTLTNLTPSALAGGRKEGDRTAYSPKWKGQFGLVYTLPVASLGGDLKFASDVTMSGSKTMGPQATQANAVPVGTQVNASLKYLSHDGNWSVGAVCANCTNVQTPASELFSVYYAAAPRTYELNFSWYFY